MQNIPLAYPIAVDQERSEIGIKEERFGIDADRTLPFPFFAQLPVRIQDAPKVDTCSFGQKFML